jgi:hypothetical protein
LSGAKSGEGAIIFEPPRSEDAKNIAVIPLVRSVRNAYTNGIQKNWIPFFYPLVPE